MKKDINSIALSWNDIISDCNRLIDLIEQSAYNIETIVMIQRGGCIPGTIMSHKIKCDDVHIIKIRTTETDDIRSSRLSTPVIFIPSIIKNIRNRNVLIIDDVTNTGVTLEYAKKEILKYQPATCKTAVLVWDGDNNEKCTADYYARHSPSWVIFPWE